MKSHVISIVALFVLVTMFGYGIHGVLLVDAYARSPMPGREPVLFGWLLLGNTFFSTAFYVLYRQWKLSAATLPNGLSFGVVIWMLWAVPIFLIDYASQPIAASLTAQQLGLEFIDMLALGAATAFLARGFRGGRPDDATARGANS